MGLTSGAWGSPRCDLTRAARRTPPLSGEPPFSHEVSEAQQHLNLQPSDNVSNHRPRLISHHRLHHERLNFHPLHFVPAISASSDLPIDRFLFSAFKLTTNSSIPDYSLHQSKWVTKMLSTWPSSPSRPSAMRVSSFTCYFCGCAFVSSLM